MAKICENSDKSYNEFSLSKNNNSNLNKFDYDEFLNKINLNFKNNSFIEKLKKENILINSLVDAAAM